MQKLFRHGPLLLCMLSLLSLFFIAFGSFLEAVGFMPQVTMISEVSPDGDKIAVVECIDEGALGGRVHGYVYRYRPDSLLDSFIRKGIQIKDMSFLYPDEITLIWKDNDTVLLNGEMHSIGDLLE